MARMRTTGEWANACRAGVGGQSSLIQEITECITRFMQDETKRTSLGLSNVLGILLEGYTGTGKRHLAKTLASTSGLPWRRVDLPRFFQMPATKICNALFQCFTEGDEQILVVEYAEAVFSRLEKESSEYDRALHSTFKLIFERLSSGPSVKVIIGVTSCLDRIDPCWLGGLRFSQVKRVAVSKPEQRLEILQLLTTLPQEDVKRVADVTHGYTVADLQKLKFEAYQVMTAAGRDSFATADFLEGMKSVSPSIMAEYYAPLPSQSMDDLVGMDSVVSDLRSFLLPFKEPKLCAKYGLSLPKGILVHGPSGSGKTHLVNGFVREAGLNYISVNASSIRSKYVGQSEKNLAALFGKARDCSPSILVIDHIDALVGRRDAAGASSTSDNSANRLITCFLTEMDGLESKRSDAKVLVIGLTEAIGKLDAAMIRPGRLGIHIQLPDRLSLKDRMTMLSRTKLRNDLSEDDRRAVAKATEGWNGSQLDGLLREAAMRALRDGVLSLSHIQSVLDRTPSFVQ